MYYTYILHSQKSSSYYTGISNDPIRRLAEHNGGFVKSTRSKRPWNLAHIEQFYSRMEALAREKFLKSGVGREERAKILHLNE